MNIELYIKQNTFLYKIYKLISSQIEAYLYIIWQQGITHESEVHIKPKLENIKVVHLGPSDMKTIHEIPEVMETEEDLIKRLKDGCLCFGLKHNDKIVGYSWYNFRRFNCHFSLKIQFPLKENEAYIFDERTIRSYRGKNLAPYLRYQSYKYLSEMERSKMYSVSSYLNTSAVKFHEKLKAKPLKFYCAISLFKKIHINIPIRKYNDPV